jgi:hypothetical protein
MAFISDKVYLNRIWWLLGLIGYIQSLGRLEMAASGCTSPVMEMKGIHCHYNLPYRNRCMALSALTLLFLSGRTNTQYSPSTASSPISLWRVFYFSNKIMIGWHGFIIPIRCVLQWQVQLKFRCHRFGHMSLTDTASTGSFEGTAIRLHAKEKPALIVRISRRALTMRKITIMSFLTTQIRC